MNHTLTGLDEAAEEERSIVVEEEYLGVRLYLKEEMVDEERSYSDGWAYHDGLLIKATSEELLRATVARMVGGGDDRSLLDQRSFWDVIERVEQSDLFFFLDFTPVVTVLEELVSIQSAGAPPNILGITPERVFEALALDVLEGFYLSLDLSTDETSVDSGFFYREKRGLVSLLAYRNGSLPHPNYIPDDSLAVSILRFDFGEFWTAMEKIISDISPVLSGLYGGYREQLSTTLGIDFNQLIIENIDEEIVTYSGFGADQKAAGNPTLEELSQVYVLKPRDLQGFEMAIGVINGLLGIGQSSWEPREYLGTTIFTRSLSLAMLSGGAGAPPSLLSYAFTEEYLLFCVGSPRLLESALARIDRSGDSLWDNRDLDLAIRKFPADSATFTYHDLNALLNSLFVTVARLQQQVEGTEDGLTICDPSNLPDKKNFPFFILGKAYAEENGFFGKSLLIRKSE
jgi:hypothetical protein